MRQWNDGWRAYLSYHLRYISTVKGKDLLHPIGFTLAAQEVAGTASAKITRWA